MTVSEKITELRHVKGLTQDALGELLGVTGQAVSKWETSASLPDILLLPKLCEIFGISIDEFLDVPAEVRHVNITRDFCASARRNGRARTCCDAVGRLFEPENDNCARGNVVSLSSSEIRVFMNQCRGKDGSVCISDDSACAFLLYGQEMTEDLLSVNAADLTELFDILTDDRVLSLLRVTSVDRAVPLAALKEASGLGDEEIRPILLTLTERNILGVGWDLENRRGYLRMEGFAGVMMILAGCRGDHCGGTGFNTVWMNCTYN
ncbi:MAG: helix-turn-helix transcriptional regulator [Clostridia bacterium]|nr:helix-turn-helix transcriptional regulator [Clostridia bacterium]